MLDRFRVYNEHNEPVSKHLTAREVIFALDGSTGFMTNWTIEWFSGDISKGTISFDQVKRFANGGYLCYPEESAGKDKMSLQEWSNRFNVPVGVHATGSRYVPDEYREGRAFLWCLTDYIVSSVTAGTIWLIQRQNVTR